ncbi:NADP-dependent oxidoreductase [Paramicrobacterium agarici]|uniref:NADPH:quinone reductase-like Zn-dependent oxidoreductase n=1 Tax=Paramicrobacterium agarici TaxID=630514 RepID=A0A2A9DTS0_9MICO|nr:NADP-dependent oxidoreductase [Microbacterium agarici]PFG29362.1 NADPH:quinone reductase-like Zn-dependent oxidoreductase [Microbacterium agarici]
MLAVRYDEFGDSSVMRVAERDEPHAREERVRIRVRAAGVNPADVKKRNGQMGEATFPVTPGFDAAGVVDEVGEGVEHVAVGDEVLGWGFRTHAEFAVLKHVVQKPPAVGWTHAAALPVVTETAERCLRLLNVREGQTIVIEGAAGGVGAAAVQLARARGARVIGTASERNHDYLASLGAEPLSYGRGIAGRVRGLTNHVDAVFDTAGSGSVPELITLVDDPAQVVSIADFTAPELGARATGGGADGAWDILADLPMLIATHGYGARVDSVFPLVDAAAAFDRVETGRPQGKVVLDVSLS